MHEHKCPHNTFTRSATYKDRSRDELSIEVVDYNGRNWFGANAVIVAIVVDDYDDGASVLIFSFLLLPLSTRFALNANTNSKHSSKSEQPIKNVVHRSASSLVRAAIIEMNSIHMDSELRIQSHSHSNYIRH